MHSCTHAWLPLTSADAGCWSSQPPSPAGRSHRSPTVGRSQRAQSHHLHPPPHPAPLLRQPSSRCFLRPRHPGMAGHRALHTWRTALCSRLAVSSPAPPCPTHEPVLGLLSSSGRSSPAARQAGPQPTEPQGRHPAGTAMLLGTLGPKAAAAAAPAGILYSVLVTFSCQGQGSLITGHSGVSDF